MNRQIRDGRPRIYFTGVGGQGTLTATRILARAAMLAGLDVVSGEVHGMAQRGGVVESTLLLGGWRAPRIDLGEADIILGFEPLETLRGLDYLDAGGIVFSSIDCLPPLNVCLGETEYPSMEYIRDETDKKAAASYFLPCNELGREAGAVLSGNSALLGALCASGILPFGMKELECGIKGELPEKIQAANLRAAELGAKFFISNYDKKPE